jgi:hypothetical protein
MARWARLAIASDWARRFPSNFVWSGRCRSSAERAGWAVSSLACQQTRPCARWGRPIVCGSIATPLFATRTSAIRFEPGGNCMGSTGPMVQPCNGLIASNSSPRAPLHCRAMRSAHELPRYLRPLLGIWLLTLRAVCASPTQLATAAMRLAKYCRVLWFAGLPDGSGGVAREAAICPLIRSHRLPASAT